MNRKRNTHAAIKLDALIERSRAEASCYRRCASKAAGVGNRNAAIWFTSQAQKWDGVMRQAIGHYQRNEKERLNG